MLSRCPSNLGHPRVYFSAVPRDLESELLANYSPFLKQ